MIMYIFSNTIQIYNKEQHQRGIIIDFHKGRHMGGGGILVRLASSVFINS